MKSVNRVILIGNVTHDCELKATKAGLPIASFGVATNRVWKDQAGAKQSLAEFHNLVAWNTLAEFCGKNVKKGKPVYVEGYLKTRHWDGTDGTKHYRTETVVDNLILLSPRAASTESVGMEPPVLAAQEA